MNLTDLFTDLALGELTNLAMAENNTIVPQKRPQITTLANDGLLDLYSRFILKESGMLVEMREAVTNYHLLKRYAMSQYDADNPPDRWNLPYIVDNLGEPFPEDVIKVLSVYNSFGQKLPLNDLEHPMSVFTPQSTIIKIPYPIPGQALSIEYQARHAVLDHCDCEEDIILPDVLWRALRAYIASKVYMHMNTQEMTAKGQEHALNMETICAEAVEKDLVNTSSTTTNVRFHKRGWK